MIVSVEHHQALPIEVKVAGLSWLRPASRALAPEDRYTILADACLIQHPGRHLRKQLMRNLRLHAPAGPFTGKCGARMTTVRLPAERATPRTAPGFGSLLIQAMFATDLLLFPDFNQSTTPPSTQSNKLPGSGTTEIASICVRPLSTSIRT
jgi:hypothetical protein